jgi:CRISPR system Cascade subunit CasB
MSLPEAAVAATQDAAAPGPATPADPAEPRSDVFGAMAAFIQRAGPGDHAALARLNPAALQPHQVAALARALLAAGLAPEQWHPDTWPRWALIAQGMALAGHDRRQALGAQLAHAGVSESRVTKLLTARGEAFVQLVPRLLRLMASQGVAPNWRELGELVLKESSTDPARLEEAEAIRLHVAGRYFSAVARGKAPHAPS